MYHSLQWANEHNSCSKKKLRTNQFSVDNEISTKLKTGRNITLGIFSEMKQFETGTRKSPELRRSGQ